MTGKRQKTMFKNEIELLCSWNAALMGNQVKWNVHVSSGNLYGTLLQSEVMRRRDST